MERSKSPKQKTVVVGAGPVGALAALYAAARGHDVEVYELRGGKSLPIIYHDSEKRTSNPILLSVSFLAFLVTSASFSRRCRIVSATR